MSLNPKQARIDLVRPILQALDPEIPYSMAAENLILGTIAHESQGGTFIHQVGGPALGICQMEPATHADHVRWLLAHQDVYKKIKQVVPTCFEARELVWNLAYAVAMARVHYWRVPKALPASNAVAELAAYWKTYYNTEQGSGTVEQFEEAYRAWVR